MKMSTFNGLSYTKLKALERNYRKMGKLINELSLSHDPEKIIALKRLYNKTDLKEIFETLRKVVRE